MRQKRESKEELERFSGEIQESISRKGRRGADLSLPGAKRNQPRVEGGTRASDIPGFIEPPSSSADSIGRDSTTIGAIYKEVAAIRKLLVEEFKPSGEELRARESELEGITPTAAARPATERRGGVLGGLFGSLMKSLGLGGGEGGGIGGTISDVLSMLPGKKLLGRAGGMIGRGLGAAGRFAGRMGGRALGLLKTTSLFKDASAIGKTVSSVGKGAFEMAKSAGTRALNAGKSVGGKALDIGKSVGGKALDIGKSVGGKALDIGKSVGGKAAGWLSNAFGSVSGAVSNLNPAKALGSAVKSGAGKLAKGIISIPGLGAIITTAMGFLDIKSIKNDPELSPDEKKERIGRTLVGTLGQALGSVGGGALGCRRSNHRNRGYGNHLCSCNTQHHCGQDGAAAQRRDERIGSRTRCGCGDSDEAIGEQQCSGADKGEQHHQQLQRRSAYSQQRTNTEDHADGFTHLVKEKGAPKCALCCETEGI
jgi:hypothetical protein